MYFWNVNALVEDFRAGQVSQRQRMHYYLANALMLVTLGELARTGHAFSGMDFLTLVLSVIITKIGISRCFETNQKGDGAEFIDRMTCLTWPISMRILAVFTPVYVVIAACTYSPSDASGADIISVIGSIGSSVYLYRWLQSCMVKIAGSISLDESAPGAAAQSA